MQSTKGVGCQSAGVRRLGYKRKRWKEEARAEEKPHHKTLAGRKMILGKQVISCHQPYKSVAIKSQINYRFKKGEGEKKHAGKKTLHAC